MYYDLDFNFKRSVCIEDNKYKDINNLNSWASPLLNKGYKRNLTVADLYNVTKDDESRKLTNDLEKLVFHLLVDCVA